MKKIYPISILIATLLAACGPQGTPTMSPADVQGTAVAAAWTMVAMTQAAIPTATPIPPTDIPSPTPLPSNTPLPPPTSSLPTLASTQGAADPNSDPCNKPMAVTPDGPHTKVLIENRTKGPANISVYLNKTLFGECGYRGYSVGKGQSITVSLPLGCYSFYAWINGNDPSTASGYGCINNDDKWVFAIGEEVVRVLPP